MPVDKRVFGRYRLLELIGQGGMGTVFKAKDTGPMDRVVALKFISAEYSQNPVFRERLFREARTAGCLGEPHVVPIHSCGEIDGQLYIDMRFVKGTDLQTVLAQHGPLDPTRAVAIIRQIAAALVAAHAENIVHRDVKPSNILVTGNDFAYLVDFGIATAKTAAGETALTRSEGILGTLKYMAPERFNNAEVGPPADSYALACVLYECLTGSAPYSGDQTVLAAAHLHAPIPLPSHHRPQISVKFDEVVKRGMAKDPSDRYTSAEDLALAAHHALAEADRDRAEIIVDKSQAGTFSRPSAGVTSAGKALSQEALQRKARAYEEIRRTQPAGYARTRAMDALVGEVYTLAAAAPESARRYTAGFLRSARAGDRIVGLSLAQAEPTADDFGDVLRIFSTSASAFEQFQSLRALHNIAPAVSAAQRREAITVLEAERADPRAVGLMNDPAIPSWIERVLQALRAEGILNKEARAYEDMRRTMQAGGARTRAMDTLVGEVRNWAAVEPAIARRYAAGFLRSARAGDRIVGLALAQGSRSTDDFGDVLLIFSTSASAFEQFHSLLALGNLARELSAMQRREAIEVLETEKADPRAVGLMKDLAIPPLIAQVQQDMRTEEDATALREWS